MPPSRALFCARTGRARTRPWSRARAPLLVLALVGVVALAACAPLAGTTTAASPVPLPGSFAPLVRRVLPTVVNIAFTERVTDADRLALIPPALRGTPLGRELRRHFAGQDEAIAGAGSGFIISPDGIVVTNNHVIAHAERILVSLPDGTEWPARVLGRDPPTDIAVLKIDPPHPLVAAQWGDSRNVQVGDWILAAGNPFGLGGSVTAGIVSAEGRSLGGGPFDRFLQLDAPINPGNSGGPTFDLNGLVVGMTTAIVSPSGGSVGIGFAIPSNLVRRVAETLIAHGSVARGWLGVAIGAGKGAGPGVPVANVTPGGPASAAGLAAGDRILAVNEAPVRTPDALIRAVADLPPGTIAHLDVRRGAARLRLDVTLGRRPPDAPH